MKTISHHQKDARNAPKFILVATHPKDGIIYIKLKKEPTDTNLTRQKSLAAKFSVGYDSEAMKSRAWSIATGITFTVQYL